MKIIDNFLSEKELELMKTVMMRKQDMPWYYNDYIASERTDKSIMDSKSIQRRVQPMAPT